MNADVGRHSRVFPVRFLEFQTPKRCTGAKTENNGTRSSSLDPRGRDEVSLGVISSPTKSGTQGRDPVDGAENGNNETLL